MKITSPEMLAIALRKARASKRLTQQETAQLVGVKQATVSAFENHPERSRVETLFKLIAALGLELYVTERDLDRDPQVWDQEW